MGGKTGTSNNHSDAWFVGVTPSLVAGAWVGGEYRSIHFRTGALGQGSRTALPIVAQFFRSVMDDASLRSKYLHKYGMPPADIDASTYQTTYTPTTVRNDSLANDSTAGNEGDFEGEDLMGNETENSHESGAEASETHAEQTPATHKENSSPIYKHNEKFISDHLVSEKSYLDGILSEVDPNIKLDDEQRKVVLSDEDYTLVIAGAGAGKTTTVSAKVKYLVERKGILPTYLCRFAVRAPQKSTQLFSPSSIPDFGTIFPRSLPEPTPGSETSYVSLCLTLLVVTESLPSVHRLRLSASP